MNPPPAPVDNFGIFRPPTLIGSFEMAWSPHGKFYREPPTGLRVLNLPPNNRHLNFDLLDGYVPVAHGGQLSGYGNQIQDRTGLMRWMARHYRLIRKNSPEKLFDFDFVTSRGTLQCIMTQICAKNKGKESIAATMYKGNIYLKVLPLAERESESSNKHGYAGLRFEEFVTRPAEGAVSQACRPGLNYSDADKYYHVLMSKFGGYSVLYSAETDCVGADPRGRQPMLQDFIEIKTSMPIREARSQDLTRNFKEVKSLKWWSQCVISGVREILVGYKNFRDFRVTDLEFVQVQDLPCAAYGWDPCKSFQFVSYFLNCVKQTVIEDDPNVVYLFVLDGDTVYKPIKQSPRDSVHYPVVTEEIVGMFADSVQSYSRASQWVLDEKESS